MAYNGIRVRVRRTRDNAIMWDSTDVVTEVTHMVTDNDGYVGVETYYLEALYVSSGTVTTGVAKMLRQVLLGMGLHR